MRRFGLKSGPESGMVFEGTTRMNERICLFNSK